MMKENIEGLIAVTFTPMKTDGSLNLDKAPEIAGHTIKNNIIGGIIFNAAKPKYQIMLNAYNSIFNALNFNVKGIRKFQIINSLWIHAENF